MLHRCPNWLSITLQCLNENMFLSFLFALFAAPLFSTTVDWEKWNFLLQILKITFCHLWNTVFSQSCLLPFFHHFVVRNRERSGQLTPQPGSPTVPSSSTSESAYCWSWSFLRSSTMHLCKEKDRCSCQKVYRVWKTHRFCFKICINMCRR